MNFKELTDLVSNDKAVLLETSALLSYVEFGDLRESIEKQIECCQMRIDFYRFLMRNLPELKNWCITPLTVEETNSKKGYPYKKLIQETDSHNHRNNIIVPIDEKRQSLEYLRKRRDEKIKIRKLIDTFENNGKILSLTSKEQQWAEYFYRRYEPQKKEIGVESLSECDWNFMISGLAIAQANKSSVSLISNDYLMIPLWGYILQKEHLNPEKFKFFIRNDFKDFIKLNHNSKQMQ